MENINSNGTQIVSLCAVIWHNRYTVWERKKSAPASCIYILHIVLWCRWCRCVCFYKSPKPSSRLVFAANNLMWVWKWNLILMLLFCFICERLRPRSSRPETKESCQAPGVLPIYIFITFQKQLLFHHILCIEKSGSVVNQWSGIHMNHIWAHECRAEASWQFHKLYWSFRSKRKILDVALHYRWRLENRGAYALLISPLQQGVCWMLMSWCLGRWVQQTRAPGMLHTKVLAGPAENISPHQAGFNGS